MKKIIRIIVLSFTIISIYGTGFNQIIISYNEQSDQLLINGTQTTTIPNSLSNLKVKSVTITESGFILICENGGQNCRSTLQDLRKLNNQ